MVGVAVRQVLEKRGALGLFGRLLKASPPSVWVPCGLGFFAWLAWFFVYTGKKVFFFFSLPWSWRGCTSNPSEVFGSQVDGLVWVWDQREWPVGEKSGIVRKLRGCSVSAPDLRKSQKRTPNPSSSSPVKRGPTPEIQQVDICLPKLLCCWVNIFSSNRGPGAMFLSPMCRVFFLFIYHSHSVFFSVCVGIRVLEGKGV